MKYSITVSSLKKKFKAYKKAQGLLGTFKNLFAREYFEIDAVDNVSFKIEQGELVGFIGPNGAGKTTTLKCLSGLLYPTSGKISVLGYTPWERDYDFLKQISLVMGQKNQLWWDLPAYDSFLLNKEIYRIGDIEFKEIVDELVELLNLKNVINIQVRKLSLGQRMRCELVAALLHSPKVLFLDEPTIGLDVVMQKKLRKFFKEYNAKYETTILLTSHYMDDVKELCKRVMIIDNGELVYDGELSRLMREHVTNKTITFVSTKSISETDLKKFGEIVSLNDNHGVLSVPKNEVAHVSAKLLKSFPIEDLDIDEMSLGDVIESMFDR